MVNGIDSKILTPMKLIHFSDTHLGFSDYSKIDPSTGINQREQDFYNAWQAVIHAILEIKPDVVLHAGDLFHTTRPTNRAIAVAMEGIQQISDAGIPLVLISGNHSTPKIKATGSIFEAISLFPNVYAAFSSRYEKFSIRELDVHCVPHCALTEELEQAFANIQLAGTAQHNVLLTHGAWTGTREFSMGEFNEQYIPHPELQTGSAFDYIALGHYHKHIAIEKHIVYAGSTERTSFNEAGYTSGFMYVDLSESSFQYIPIPSRPMIKLPPLDCTDLTVADIFTRLEKMATSDLEQSLVSVELNNINHDTLIAIDWRQIDQMFSHVFYLEKVVRQRFGKAEHAISTSMDSLPVEFERYMERLELGDLDKTRLKSLGLAYFADALEI